MLKFAVVLVGLFGVGLVFSAPAEEARVNRTLIPLSGGKTRASTGIFFGPEELTWGEAKQSCQQAGLSLLVLDTKLKQDKFFQDLGGSLSSEFDGFLGLSWTAGTDQRSTTGEGVKRFYWSAAGSEQKAMKYFNFAGGNECDPGHGCVAVSNKENDLGKWIVLSCQTEKPYLCERT